MSPEFEPGVFHADDLFYGFGSYLREVLLPGEMRPADIGNDVVFFERQGKNGATLHVMTRYDMPEFDPGHGQRARACESASICSRRTIIMMNSTEELTKCTILSAHMTYTM